MPKKSQRTLYFGNRSAEEISQIVTETGLIARELGVGTNAGDLLAAVSKKLVSVAPVITPDISTPPQMTLAQALDRAASALQSTNPGLAEELRKRAWLVAAALG